MRTWGLAVVLACGCGSPDAGPPDALVPGANYVRLRVGYVDALAYRNGDGPWQEVAPDRYLWVDDDYEIAFGCRTVSGFSATVEARVYTPDARADVDCAAPLGPDSLTHTVTGHMLQAGAVWMGHDHASSATGPWDFALDVAAGTYDLFAFDDARGLMRRGVSVIHSMGVADVDLDAGGTAFVDVPLTLNGAAGGAAITTQVDWAGGNSTWGVGPIVSSGTTTRMPPLGILVDPDYLDLDVTAATPTTQQTAHVQFFNGTQTELDLPPPPAIAFAEEDGQIVATWDALPPFDTLTYTLARRDGSSLRVSTDAAYVARPGAARALVYDATGAPGFDPSWTIDPSEPYTRTVELVASGNATSMLRESVP
jgi:hypothetical protein